MTEAQFAAWLNEVAAVFHWDLRYHTYDSRHSAKGFPDEVFVRPPRMLVAELKVGRREPTPEQKRWLLGLAAIPGLEVYVWWPDNRDQIERVLR